MFRIVMGLQYLSWIKDLELLMKAFTVSFYGIMLLVVLVLIAFFYFGAAAMLLFKESDPYHFGSVGSTLSSMFQILT